MSSQLRNRRPIGPGDIFLPPDPHSEEPYRVSPQIALRIAILAAIALVIFAALFFRLWALQVISGDHYLAEAGENQVRTFRVEAPRGSIVDRKGRMLVSSMPGTSVELWTTDLPDSREREVSRRLSELLGVPRRQIARAIREHRDDPLTPVTIKSGVKEWTVSYLLEHGTDFPGVQIADSQLRRYTQGPVAAQLLGYVSEISKKQLKELAQAGYAAGDRIGQAGVEASYDKYLRGAAGVGQVRIDALGRFKGERELRQLPEGGNTLRLTIDADLQSKAEQALREAIARARRNGDWAANGGAIVAMDPRTGEILALASNPSFDPSVYVGRVDAKELKRLGAPQANHPTLNRAIDGLYPPGSTFKPVTALAAMQEGALSPGEPIQCSPQLNVDGTVFKNWTYTDEAMTLPTAIAASCDTYFYQVGLRFYRMPEERGSPLQRWAQRMGFGRKTGVDVGPEATGLVPTPAWRKRTFDDPIDRLWKSGDSVQLAIGQKDMLATPLQMTRFYALVANGGKLVQPHVLAAVERAGANGLRGEVLAKASTKPPRDIGLNPAALHVVQQGLYDATHASYGTSSGIFRSFPVAIAGKTGTAEKVVDLPGFQGTLDQAWWCGYGPYSEPELAVCALVENGGFGGEVAAPAALKVFEEYFGVEGGPISQVKSD